MSSELRRRRAGSTEAGKAEEAAHGNEQADEEPGPPQCPCFSLEVKGNYRWGV